MGTGSGYGKVILFNEHFVVYGIPAIASAIESRTEAVVEQIGEDQLIPSGNEGSMAGNGWVLEDNRPANPGYKIEKLAQQKESINLVLNASGFDARQNDIRITLGGDLKAVGGVGASAAVCVSVARALNDEYGLGFDDNRINKIAYEGEKAYHGTPSGIDNTASTYGGLIFFVKNLSGGKNTMDLLQSPRKMPLIIANSGITASTAEVVADVRRLKDGNLEKFEKIFDQYKKIAEKAKNALLKGNITLVGEFMNQNHKLLQKITVSGEINDKLVEIALQNGAIGAKMTGTGRGGLVIALAENAEIQENIAKAIEKEGCDAWKTMIG